MAGISQQKMKEIEAEMDRFEEEISGEPPPPPSASRMIIGAKTYGHVEKKLKVNPEDAPRFNAMAPPPPPPLLSTAPPRKPSPEKQKPMAPPPPPPSFLPPQLRHRGPPHPGGPPRPPHMRPPPPRPPHGMPPRGPPPRGPPPFMGPPRPPPPPMGPHGPMRPPGPPGGMGPPMRHPGMRPPGPPMGPGPMGGGPMRGPPPPGYPGPRPQLQQQPQVEQTPSAVISGAKVVYAKPVKAADAVKEQLKASKKAKKEKKEKDKANIAPGIEVNIPVSEVESNAPAQAEQPVAGPHIVVPDIDVEAFVKKFQADKAKKEKKKKFVRTAAGQTWEDTTLEEWDPDDFRIFCGDLGNEVTDEVLARAFSRFPTFQKAKVVRDRRSNKTKGFGFVSFKDPNDFVKAMREMNGKYVGNRPIKLRKSNWRDRQIDVAKKKDKEKKKLGLR